MIAPVGIEEVLAGAVYILVQLRRIAYEKKEEFGGSNC